MVAYHLDIPDYERKVCARAVASLEAKTISAFEMILLQASIATKRPTYLSINGAKLLLEIVKAVTDVQGVHKVLA